MKDNAWSLREQTYHHIMMEKNITPDSAQKALIKQLAYLADELQKKTSSWLFPWRKKPNLIKGLYIYGQVGRGKSMLMDLFYENLESTIKRRVHFNEFMQDVQMRLESARQIIKTGKTKNHDPIIPVAASLAQQAKILCFDEFSVTDIADAMILGRLFAQLFKHGVVLIATSNVAPDELYKNGLNRALFLPFIEILKQNVLLFNLDGVTDYRMEKHRSQKHYFSPLTTETARQMEKSFVRATNSAPPQPQEIALHGRKIHVPLAVGGVARFDFNDLCAKPLSHHDYAVLAKKYHSFFIENVPIFDNSMRNEAKRFILAIDTFYEARACLFISAAAPPDQLYQTNVPTIESFEFNRTASRLYEMQSAEYLEHFLQNVSGEG